MLWQSIRLAISTLDKVHPAVADDGPGVERRCELRIGRLARAVGGALEWEERAMLFNVRIWAALAGVAMSGSIAVAQTLPTHRIPAALAAEAASETVSVCAKQGYRETAQVVDADGAIIATLRGEGAGIHSLDSALDKAYTAVSFKSDTLALGERAKEDALVSLAKLPHVMFLGGGMVIKLGDEIIGAIGAAGAPGAKLDDTCARAGLDKIKDRLQ
jgi:uncharacterized protein GlcG (DUF336 family)